MKGHILIEDNEIDISKRQPILWGVSWKSVRLCDETGMNDFAYIVDNDISKQGQLIKIGGMVKRIESPKILEILTPNKYFICLFTENHNAEIRNYIENFLGVGYLILDNTRNFVRSYDSLFELMTQDYFIINKTLELNIYSEIPYYIKQIEKEIKKIDANFQYFEPIKKGHKLIIKAVGEKETVVISISSNSSRIPSSTWHDTLSDLGNSIEIFSANRNIPMLSELTYYVDKNGLLIQKYCADKRNFKDDVIRKKVLQKLRALHDFNYDIQIKADPIKRFECLYMTLNFDTKNKLKRIQDCIQKYKRQIMTCPVVLSHGDFHHGNIVFDQDECFFIDWEYLCMTYEYYDVCRFLYYSQMDEFSDDNILYDREVMELYYRAEKYISFYKSVTVKDIIIFKRMLFLCEGIELILRINRKQHNAEELIDVVEKHIGLVEKG